MIIEVFPACAVVYYKMVVRQRDRFISSPILGCAKRDGRARYASRRYIPFVVKLAFKFDRRLRLDQNCTSGLTRSGRVR